MHLSLTAALLPVTLLLTEGVAAVRGNDTNEYNGICSNLQSLNSCSKTIKVPSGPPKIKTCDQESFTLDPCKTKEIITYACGLISWNKVKTCTKEVCVPGTVSSTIKVPCGVTIPTKEIPICKAVSSALGSAGQQLIDKAGAMCKCLPKAIEMSATSLSQSLRGGNPDLSVAVSNMIHDYNELQTCMAENGFSVQDNKAGLFQESGALSSQGGKWTVLQAAEIDLTTYGDLAAALAPCAAGGACQPQLIKNFFIRYLEDSKKQMGDQLAVVLKKWTDILGNVEKNLGTIGDSAEDLVSNLKGLPSKLEEVKNKVCQGKTNDQCADQAAQAYLDKLTKAISTVERLEKVREAANSVTETTPKLIKPIEDTIEAAEATPDLEYIVELAKDGKLKKIEDVLQAFRGATELPKLVAELQESGKTIVDFIAQYSSKTAENEIQEILRLVEEVFSPELPQAIVPELVKEIQILIQQEIQTPLEKLRGSIHDLGNILNTLPVIHPGKFDLKAGVASYQRWSMVSFDLPCSRMETAKFSHGKFHAELPYPVFYRCAYKGPNRLPWPNHHIPYVKFRLG
ncbi:hypothetical protein V8F20_008062 [Naviculisporaceae sp. PSN 640]